MNKSKVQELLDSIPRDALAKLETTFEQKRELTESLSEKDKRIIGDLLYALHDLEEILDYAILWFVFPIFKDPLREKFEEYILSKTDLRSKLKFACEIKILSDKQRGCFQYLADKRNELAHRRVKGKKPHDGFTEKEQKDFLEKKDQLVEMILVNLNHNIGKRFYEFITSMSEASRGLNS
jgi:hypothetical protein